MSMNDPHNDLGSIWYHSESEPSDVPYYPNQFLGWAFFCRFLQQDDSTNIKDFDLIDRPLSTYLQVVHPRAPCAPTKKVRFHTLSDITVQWCW